ncbi:MAG: AMP-binding protein [Alicyclobacillus sp.]|nr:AMP-binding protein [Alicyclobacillus sp.]
MRHGLIPELLADAAWQSGDVEVVSGQVRYTYAEAWERVVRLARSMKQIGIHKGTVVGVLDVNSHRYFELQYALGLVGAVVHTLNFRLPLADLAFTVQHARDEVLFVWDGFRPLGEALRRFVRGVVWMPEAGSAPPAAATAEAALAVAGETRPADVSEWPDYESLIQSQPAGAAPPPVELQDTDAYSVFYTTGTTGRPKGMIYRHRDMMLAPLQIAHHLAIHDTGAALRAGDTIMPLIPFFHIHGWGTPFFAPYLGNKLVLPERADAAAQLALIRAEQVTWSNMVPTQLAMLLDALADGPSPDATVAQLRLKVLTGGSPLPSGLAKRAHRAGVAFSLIYGGSDQLGAAISAVRQPMSDEALRVQSLSTTVQPLPMVRMRVCDTTGHDVPRDGATVGELWVQSPWLPSGYLDNPAASQAAYQDGWFHSGDLAVWLPDGSFQVVDRVKDAVKSGGEWIATSVVEAVLSEIPGVALAAVIPVPDERWGERPLAILQAGEDLQEETVRAHLDSAVASGVIARFWVPDRIQRVAEIPLTSAGKVHKAALRAQYTP